MSDNMLSDLANTNNLQTGPIDFVSFNGYVATTVDAIRIALAAQHGVIPRVARRFDQTERANMVRSGATFVFTPSECGIERWTDRLLWSPSRIEGNFLAYYELERTERKKKIFTIEDCVPGRNAGSVSRQRIKPYTKWTGPAKANGMMKRTITIRVSGVDNHIVCYYRTKDLLSGALRRPTAEMNIMSQKIDIQAIKSTKLRRKLTILQTTDNSNAIVDSEETQFLESLKGPFLSTPIAISRTPIPESKMSNPSFTRTPTTAVAKKAPSRACSGSSVSHSRYHVKKASDVYASMTSSFRIDSHPERISSHNTEPTAVEQSTPPPSRTCIHRAASRIINRPIQTAVHRSSSETVPEQLPMAVRILGSGEGGMQPTTVFAPHPLRLPVYPTFLSQ